MGHVLAAVDGKGSAMAGSVMYGLRPRGNRFEANRSYEKTARSAPVLATAHRSCPLSQYRTSKNYRDGEFLGPRIGDKILIRCGGTCCTAIQDW